MFAFMIHPDRHLRDGSKYGLMKGFMLWNSEVGKSQWGIQTFYFRGVCGNHIVLGAQDVKVLKGRHVGRAGERAFEGLEVTLERISNESTTEFAAKIERARRFVIKSTNKADVLDVIFGQRQYLRIRCKRRYFASRAQSRYAGRVRSGSRTGDGCSILSNGPFSDRRGGPIRTIRSLDHLSKIVEVPKSCRGSNLGCNSASGIQRCLREPSGEAIHTDSDATGHYLPGNFDNVIPITHLNGLWHDQLHCTGQGGLQRTCAVRCAVTFDEMVDHHAIGDAGDSLKEGRRLLNGKKRRDRDNRALASGA